VFGSIAKMSTLSEGERMPLQLTTITVAVPSPLSPNSAAVLNVSGMNMVGQGGHVTPLTLPVTQQECGTFKWKYEQTRTEKLNSTLVRKKTVKKEKKFLNQNKY